MTRQLLPLIYVHEQSGQPDSCLLGLVSEYAPRIMRDSRIFGFPTPKSFEDWMYVQPVSLDMGEGPNVPGCIPEQRSRVFPPDYNCWEATAHAVAAAFANRWQYEVHVYDMPFRGGRHVFPALRIFGRGSERPEPMLLQPPVTPALGAAQAWQGDAIGVLHKIGSAVLGAFGLSGVAKGLEDIEQTYLPDDYKPGSEYLLFTQPKPTPPAPGQAPPRTDDLSATDMATLAQLLKQLLPSLASEQQAKPGARTSSVSVPAALKALLERNSATVKGRKNTSRFGAEEYAPESAEEYAPEPAEEYAPEPAEEYAPEPAEEYAPESAEEYAPESAEEYAPEPAEEYAPDSAEDSGGPAAADDAEPYNLFGLE